MIHHSDRRNITRVRRRSSPSLRDDRRLHLTRTQNGGRSWRNGRTQIQPYPPGRPASCTACRRLISSGQRLRRRRSDCGRGPTWSSVSLPVGTFSRSAQPCPAACRHRSRLCAIGQAAVRTIPRLSQELEELALLPRPDNRHTGPVACRLERAPATIAREVAVRSAAKPKRWLGLRSIRRLPGACSIEPPLRPKPVKLATNEPLVGHTCAGSGLAAVGCSRPPPRTILLGRRHASSPAVVVHRPRRHRRCSSGPGVLTRSRTVSRSTILRARACRIRWVDADPSSWRSIRRSGYRALRDPVLVRELTCPCACGPGAPGHSAVGVSMHALLGQARQHPPVTPEPVIPPHDRCASSRSLAVPGHWSKASTPMRSPLTRPAIGDSAPERTTRFDRSPCWTFPEWKATAPSRVRDSQEWSCHTIPAFHAARNGPR